MSERRSVYVIESNEAVRTNGSILIVTGACPGVQKNTTEASRRPNCWQRRESTMPLRGKYQRIIGDLVSYLLFLHYANVKKPIYSFVSPT